MGIKNIIREGLAGLWDFIYPGSCLGCGCYLENHRRIICAECLKKIDFVDFLICIECQSPLSDPVKCQVCSASNPTPVIALGQYFDPLKEIIHQFKFQNIRSAASFLGREILERHREKILNLRAEVIVPVPLHSIRQKVRGFNQAAVLAEVLAADLKLEVNDNSLEKIRRTRDQVRLSGDRRRGNLKGSFRVIDNELKDKRIILVDDVMTTGATLREVRKEIIKAGGKPVLAVVAAAAGL